MAEYYTDRVGLTGEEIGVEERDHVIHAPLKRQLIYDGTLLMSFLVFPYYF